MAVEVETTVLVPAPATAPGSPYDLTTLPCVRDELSIPENDTSNDSFLCRAIRQASSAIAHHCNRVFPVESIQDLIYIQQDPYPYQVPGGVFPLQLSRWPLVKASPVTVTGNTNGSIVITGIASTTGIIAGQLIFASDGSLPQGTTVQTVNLSSLVLSSPSSSKTQGVSFTTSIEVVQELAVGETQTLVYGQDYSVDSRRGWLIRLNAWTGLAQKWEAVPTTVQYTAGYAKVPDDLEDACLRLVTARFRSRGRDPMLVQRDQPGLGPERYWIGQQPGAVGSLAPEIAALVDHYRVPVAA